VPLPRRFYLRPARAVARDLLGCLVVSRRGRALTAGRIVETEAYLGPEDAASHAAFRRGSHALIYGEGGYAYVYLNYGIHYLVNAVTESEGSPAAVLIRALEPIDGIDVMTRRRKGGRDSFFTNRRMSPDAINLCRGPGNLTQALGITLDENRLDLTSSRLSIEDRNLVPQRVAWGPRIGIRHGTERPWRCWIEGHPCVSGPRARMSRSIVRRSA
jgi:DNA-3-methyladenine glycosylase